MEIKKNVLTELRDGVLIVTLNREERRNAIDPDTANELEAIFNHAEGSRRGRPPHYRRRGAQLLRRGGSGRTGRKW